MQKEARFVDCTDSSSPTIKLTDQWAQHHFGVFSTDRNAVFQLKWSVW